MMMRRQKRQRRTDVVVYIIRGAIFWNSIWMYSDGDVRISNTYDEKVVHVISIGTNENFYCRKVVSHRMN